VQAPNINNLHVDILLQQMRGNTGFCERCKRQVDIINIIPSSNYDQLVFSCGDISKVIKRSKEIPVSIEDKIWASKRIKIEPLNSISIPVIVFGDNGIKASGILVPTLKINMENGNYIVDKPQISNLSQHDDKSDPISYLPNTLDDIFLRLDESNHSQNEKINIRKIVNQIDRQIKLKPLPSIISSLGTLSTYIPMAAPYLQLLISKYLRTDLTTNSRK